MDMPQGAKIPRHYGVFVNPGFLAIFHREPRLSGWRQFFFLSHVTIPYKAFPNKQRRSMWGLGYWAGLSIVRLLQSRLAKRFDLLPGLQRTLA